MNTIIQRLATELAIQPKQIEATVALLDEGATVPFIARYRKERTGGLDDTQLRTLVERFYYLQELEDRRLVIIKSIEVQEKLTPALKKAILAAETKTKLEDLYLPYKPKRRTKATQAKEAGLEPLALALLEDQNLSPEETANAYLNEEHKVLTAKDALMGARYILTEKFSESADLLEKLRAYIEENAIVVSTVVEGKEKEGAKFRDYFDYKEPLKRIPSHRALALFRGRKEGFIHIHLQADAKEHTEGSPCESIIASHFTLSHQNRPADAWLMETVRFAWNTKLFIQLELQMMSQLREKAEEEAIRVFAQNLKDLLLAAPAGQKTTLGLDPGIRTGVKAAVIDSTGKLLDTATIYPFQPKNHYDESIVVLAALCEKHQVSLVGIGNGTASRETDKLVLDLTKKYPKLSLQKVVVSEAGASVYSASSLAAKEFPQLDVSLRGAVSIARRLQDPLAELVKIEPKAIGVGQYQHDVNQTRLNRMLDNVVEDCVNAVGVDLNTASAPLLRRVAGLNETLANKIVDFRDAHGAFVTRETLKEVPRLGEKTFEQAAGFLRIREGKNPLDASGVHPEAYPVVEKIIQETQQSIQALMGNSSLLKQLTPTTFITDSFGLPTIVDIIAELDKPGRDPRPEFKTAQFQEGIEKVADVKTGMRLEGAITNVTNFGAFVDIGVHQDGLVHISEMADEFVKDPRQVVKAGDIVAVTVMEVDLERKRIQLSMKSTSGKIAPQSTSHKPQRTAKPRTTTSQKASNKNSAMADALMGLKLRDK